MNTRESLMQNFQAGDEIVFQHFMKRHLRALTFHAYNICMDQQVAEEIVADAFSKLWERKSAFDSEYKIKSFLYITTRNASLDYMRSARKQHSRKLEELDGALELKEKDPLTHLIHAELIQTLISQVQLLPPRQRSVFQLHYLEGMSTEEICDFLNCSPNAVFVAKKKAMATIRKIFKKHETLISILMLFVFFC